MNQRIRDYVYCVISNDDITLTVDIGHKKAALYWLKAKPRIIIFL